MSIKTRASQFLGKIHFLLLLLLFAACNHSPKDDGTSPASLLSQPQTNAANPKGGYAINPVTGDSIKPIILSSGDTLLTGVPIPAKGKLIHPDSVEKPRVVKATLPESLEKHNAKSNRHKIPENIPTIRVDHSQLKTLKFGEGNKDFVLINSSGDTIPTGIPITAKGKTVKVIQPPPTKALPLAFKDAALTNLQYLDVDQGMSSSYITSILEDKSGNLWFGTRGGGVSKYNGESFVHFTKAAGLSNNRVASILEDTKGNLWFGTGGGGVSKYDGESFVHFNEAAGLSNNRVWSILEDKSGNLWFATRGRGVSKYDGESFVHFTEAAGLSSNKVTSILEDKSGNLWFGTAGGGVSKYDGESFVHFNEAAGLSSNFVISSLEDKSGNLWFGTVGGGVSKYDGESFVHFTEAAGLSNNTVWSILEDKSGNLWFGTEGGGVSKYDGESFVHLTEAAGLSNNKVISILEDTSGNLWFGTWGGGVSKYNGESFVHFTEAAGLSNNRVRSILEDTSSNLWFGTEDGGVSKYNGESFVHFSKATGLSSNRVLSILEDKSGNLWFGTGGGGVSKYDGESFVHFTEAAGLSHNVVLSILEDKSGNLWFGTELGGVSKYDGESFVHFTEASGLSNNRVRSILEDKSGNLWFGTEGGGVSKYDGESFVHFTEAAGLSNNTVWSILEDKSGNLWFGTEDRGVSKYDGESFVHFSKATGLSNNSVRTILEDNSDSYRSGNLYLATEKGITQISTLPTSTEEEEEEVFAIQVFGTQDGVKGLDFYQNAALIDSKNRAWWGSGKGLTMLDLNKLNSSTQIPEPLLKQLDINEQFIDYRNISGPDSPDSYRDEDRNREDNDIIFNGVQKFENYPLNLKLPYNKNHLTFHFAAIDWKAQHKIHYSHRMLGLNDNWSIPSKEVKTDYRNLPYGTYTFQIKAIGERGGWSEPFEYPFTINPPWWLTWWAWCSYAVLLLLMLYWIYGFLLRRKLEHVEVKRLQELDKFKTRLYTNLTHEFRTPLTVISGITDHILTQPSLENLENGLPMLKRNSAQLLRLINQMLDLSKLDSGRMLAKMIHDDILGYLKYLTESFDSFAESKDIRLHILSGFEALHMDFDPEKIQAIFSNLVGNAVKFTPPGGNIYIKLEKITSLEMGEFLEIKVKDTGKGISSEHLPYIFDRFYQVDNLSTRSADGTGIGLALTKELVQLMSGTIEVNSQLGKGSEFTLRLPITNEAPKGNAGEFVMESHPNVQDLVDVSGFGTAEDYEESLPLALLVEDNEDVLSYLELCLQGKYRIQKARNGLQGIQLAIEMIPDIIVSDVMMPEKDGYEVVERLKKDERTSHIPIILLTAKTDMESRLEGLESGADAYLSKPFEKKELEVRLRKLIELRQKMTERYAALIPEGKPETQIEIQEDAFLKKLHAIVDANLESEAFGIGDLCEELAVSRTQLHRKLKALTNKSTSQVIRTIRMQEAKKLLLNSNLNITEIGYAVGYSNPSYFTQEFTKEFGEAPSFFRKG